MTPDGCSDGCRRRAVRGGVDGLGVSVLAAMHGVSLSITTFSKNGGAVTVSGGAGDGGDIGMPSSDVAEERTPPNEVFGGVFGVEEMAIDACRLPEMKWRNVERMWMKPVPLRVRSMRDRSAVRLAGGVRCVS
ncbi:hypothetical protein J3L14_24870 [Burkholderia pseudomallei]|uniref:hypothetical protein n=1 Tax=Burkholderia pseudomallei TaxID=28450 RepID=UPI00193C903D|nr:hypothetical protein [Burkholderia pseudomallei]MBO3032646.1 hypothetical protein [Burkholderia pseudomallei]QRM26014.1 hypothetical protein JQX71_20010 [Burkholderia pseudomallei]QTB81316.1 hypothetical protein J3L14_24870 [Burkholderia pseudomallei]